MQRREFIASTAGLAAAVVVGGVPALAGGEVVDNFPELLKCNTIMRQRVVATGTWEVWGYLPGLRDRVCVGNCDEDSSEMLTQRWIGQKFGEGKAVHGVDHTDMIRKWRGEYQDSCNGIGIDVLENYFVIVEAC